MKKNILLLTTGGTIASTSSDDGLRPTASGKGLLNLLGPLDYNISIRDLRSLIGNVNQEAILFNDTIFNNISFEIFISVYL